MPRYDFRCRACGDFDDFHPLAAVPDAVACPTCTQPAARRPTGGVLLHGGSTAMRLLDSTARTASEPSVVAAPPPGARRPVTRNPLHRKLPRH